MCYFEGDSDFGGGLNLLLMSRRGSLKAVLGGEAGVACISNTTANQNTNICAAANTPELWLEQEEQSTSVKRFEKNDIYEMKLPRELSSGFPSCIASGNQTGQHYCVIHHVVQLIVLSLQPQIKDLLILSDE